MRIAALVWLVVVMAVCCGLAIRVHRGICLQTDMTALLPVEERDPIADRAKHQALQLLAGRVIIMFGDRDRTHARAAGAMLANALTASGLTSNVSYRHPANAWSDISRMYFPFRYGLLSEGDRERLNQNRGQQIVERALAGIYAPTSPIDAQLLRRDPFLLLPDFLIHLPKPLAAVMPDDGILSVREGDLTWVVLIAQLNGNAYAGAYQDRFLRLFNSAIGRIGAKIPSIRMLRLGAVFYAQAGGHRATTEAARLSIVSTVGSIILILVVFRALRPLWLTLLAIAVGAMCAFAACLLVYSSLHLWCCCSEWASTALRLTIAGNTLPRALARMRGRRSSVSDSSFPESVSELLPP